MTKADLKDLLKRVQAWPEAAQDELVALANQIENELRSSDYVATREELQVIDAAMASIDAVKLLAKARSKPLSENSARNEACLFAAGASGSGSDCNLLFDQC